MLTESKMNAFDKLSQISKMRQREVYCPINRQRAITGTLLTKDDLMLKTAIVSPDLYQLELSRVIFNYTSFPDINSEVSFNDFLNNVSYIDRMMLIWGVFASTYRTLGKQRITCNNVIDNRTCGYQFESEILAEELVQEDTVTLWDKPQKFIDYEFIITKEFNIPDLYKIDFITKLPTIKNHIDVIRLIPSDKIRENFERFGDALTKPEIVATVTKCIKIYSSPDDEHPIELFSPNDIHYAISKFIPIDIADGILEPYNNEFSKFMPVFKKRFKCEQCQQDFDHFVNIEFALFRQFFR